jgi:hypothetical protein
MLHEHQVGGKVWRLRLDKYQWYLERWKPNSKTGGGKWEPTYFYFKLSQVMQRLAELELAESDVEGVEQIIEAIERSTARLVEAIEEAGLAGVDTFINASIHAGKRKPTKHLTKAEWQAWVRNRRRP